MYIIYKHTCLDNNKSYIGYTKHSLDVRFSQHLYESRNGSSRLFHKALRKYSNWFSEILYYCFDIEEAKDKECYFIIRFNTLYYQNGYNMTNGGDGPPLNIDLSGKNNPFYGKKHNIETKNKISETKKGICFWNSGNYNIYNVINHENSKKYQRNKIKPVKVKNNNGDIFLIYGKKKRKEFCDRMGFGFSTINRCIRNNNKIIKQKNTTTRKYQGWSFEFCEV